MDIRVFLRTSVVVTFVGVLLIGSIATVAAPVSVNAQVSVDAGGVLMLGNGTSPLTAFIPQHIEINAGESVVWNNPTPVAEPHTITFFSDDKLFAPPVAPFIVSNSTEFTPVSPEANVEPSIIPSSSSQNETADATKTVVIDNARSTSPVVIDSTGENVTYLSPNATYTMQGNEQYLNSGWMWPEGTAPPGSPYIATFTVKFENPGTYNYLCIIHPWMVGSITVN